MWAAMAEILSPFAKHLPTVAVASACAALWGVCRAWRSSGRRSRNCGCLSRCLSSAAAAIIAAMGAAIFTGLIVESLTGSPWLVVMAGASAGVVIDVTAANGPQRMVDAALVLLSRLRRIWSEDGGSESRRR